MVLINVKKKNKHIFNEFIFIKEIQFVDWVDTFKVSSLGTTFLSVYILKGSYYFNRVKIYETESTELKLNW